MRERITSKHIDNELHWLNEAMGTPQETINGEDRKFNIGNVHVYGTNVVQTKNEAGGISVLAQCSTMREAHSHIAAMAAAVREYKNLVRQSALGNN